MKKFVKTALSLLLSAAVFFGAMPAAFAEGKLSAVVEYNEYGIAIVTVSPSSNDLLVRFTTDGSVPTFSSEAYTGRIYIGTEVLLRIAEFTADGKRVSGIKRTVKPKEVVLKAANPEFSLIYRGGYTEVSIITSTPGASVFCTVDGTSPTEQSIPYRSSLVFMEKTVVRARAFAPGYEMSDVVTITADVAEAAEPTVSDGGDIVPVPSAEPEKQEAAPEPEKEKEPEEPEKVKLEPDVKEASGVSKKIRHSLTNMTESGGTYVSVTPSMSGRTIYYTTDGTAPVKGVGKKYSKRVKFAEPGYFRAYEYSKSGEITAKLAIEVEPQCALPEFSCTGFYGANRVIKLTTKTADAEIYYTLDGTDPIKSPTAKKYTEPVTMDIFDFIKAVVKKEGYKDGKVIKFQAAEAIYHQKDFNFSNPIYTEMAVLINSERAKAGVGALTLDEKITEAANVRAEELASFWSHARPNTLSYQTALSEAGVTKIVSCGEYICSDCDTAQEAFNAMSSDVTSRAAALERDLNAIGVGYYKDSEGHSYWCIIVGKLF